MFLHFVKAQGQYRHISHSHFFQRLSQHPDIVGCPAASSCLKEDKGHLMGIVFAALKGVDELPRHADGRITHVVMYMFKAFVYDSLSPGMKNFYIVSILSKYPHHQFQMEREDIWSQDGIVFSHLLGKYRSIKTIITRKGTLFFFHFTLRM